jgi:2OG-Fe(II) oxygenase superfamily
MRLLTVTLSYLLTSCIVLAIATAEEAPTCSTPECSGATTRGKYEGVSLASLLKERFRDNPSALLEIEQKLHDGQLVVIQNALPVELADEVHQHLDSIPLSLWQLNENFLPDGFCYRHHNLYDWSSFTPLLNRTLHMFHHPDTLAFISELSGRNCYGDLPTGGNPPSSPSWYMPGDYSLPHSDHIGHRTVAYVWHLSKNWRPEWGGALYWAAHGEPLRDSFQHASYNTLVLFSVTPASTHMVTAVSPPAQGKRLAFNGWWSTDWRAHHAQHILTRLDSPEPLADLEINEIRKALEGGRLDPTKNQEIQRKLTEVHRTHYPIGNVGVY